MALVYGYLIAWIAGGVGLITTLLLPIRRAPIPLLFGLLGFGGAGFAAHGLAIGPWQLTAGCAALSGLLLAALGAFAQSP